MAGPQAARGRFTLLKQLQPEDMPEGWRHQEAIDIIHNVGQRVVKLYITRMSKKRPSNIYGDRLDYGGTGFAYYVSGNVIKIRTSKHVLYNEEEARGATVEFTLNAPGASQPTILHLEGTDSDFYSSDTDDYTSFTCHPTSQFCEYLHVFNDVPVVWGRDRFFNTNYDRCMDGNVAVKSDGVCGVVAEMGSASSQRPFQNGSGVSEQIDAFRSPTSRNEADVRPIDKGKHGVNTGLESGKKTRTYSARKGKPPCSGNSGHKAKVCNPLLQRNDRTRVFMSAVEPGDYIAILAHPSGGEKVFSVGLAVASPNNGPSLLTEVKDTVLCHNGLDSGCPLSRDPAHHFGKSKDSTDLKSHGQRSSREVDASGKVLEVDVTERLIVQSDTETSSPRCLPSGRQRGELVLASDKQRGQSLSTSDSNSPREFKSRGDRIYQTHSSHGCSGAPVILLKRSLRHQGVPVLDKSQHSGTCFFRDGVSLGFSTCFMPTECEDVVQVTLTPGGAASVSSDEHHDGIVRDSTFDVFICPSAKLANSFAASNAGETLQTNTDQESRASLPHPASECFLKRAAHYMEMCRNELFRATLNVNNKPASVDSASLLRLSGGFCDLEGVASQTRPSQRSRSHQQSQQSSLRRDLQLHNLPLKARFANINRALLSAGEMIPKFTSLNSNKNSSKSPDEDREKDQDKGKHQTPPRTYSQVISPLENSDDTDLHYKVGRSWTDLRKPKENLDHNNSGLSFTEPRSRKGQDHASSNHKSRRSLFTKTNLDLSRSEGIYDAVSNIIQPEAGDSCEKSWSESRSSSPVQGQPLKTHSSPLPMLTNCNRLRDPRTLFFYPSWNRAEDSFLVRNESHSGDSFMTRTLSPSRFRDESLPGVDSASWRPGLCLDSNSDWPVLSESESTRSGHIGSLFSRSTPSDSDCVVISQSESTTSSHEQAFSAFRRSSTRTLSSADDADVESLDSSVDSENPCCAFESKSLTCLGSREQDANGSSSDESRTNTAQQSAAFENFDAAGVSWAKGFWKSARVANTEHLGTTSRDASQNWETDIPPGSDETLARTAPVHEPFAGTCSGTPFQKKVMTVEPARRPLVARRPAPLPKLTDLQELPHSDCISDGSTRLQRNQGHGLNYIRTTADPLKDYYSFHGDGGDLWSELSGYISTPSTAKPSPCFTPHSALKTVSWLDEQSNVFVFPSIYDPEHDDTLKHQAADLQTTEAFVPKSSDNSVFEKTSDTSNVSFPELVDVDKPVNTEDSTLTEISSVFHSGDKQDVINVQSNVNCQFITSDDSALSSSDAQNEILISIPAACPRSSTLPLCSTYSSVFPNTLAYLKKTFHQNEGAFSSAEHVMPLAVVTENVCTSEYKDSGLNTPEDTVDFDTTTSAPETDSIDLASIISEFEISPLEQKNELHTKDVSAEGILSKGHLLLQSSVRSGQDLSNIKSDTQRYLPPGIGTLREDSAFSRDGSSTASVSTESSSHHKSYFTSATLKRTPLRVLVQASRQLPQIQVSKQESTSPLIFTDGLGNFDWSTLMHGNSDTGTEKLTLASNNCSLRARKQDRSASKNSQVFRVTTSGADKCPLHPGRAYCPQTEQRDLDPRTVEYLTDVLSLWSHGRFVEPPVQHRSVTLKPADPHFAGVFPAFAATGLHDGDLTGGRSSFSNSGFLQTQQSVANQLAVFVHQSPFIAKIFNEKTTTAAKPAFLHSGQSATGTLEQSKPKVMEQFCRGCSLSRPSEMSVRQERKPRTILGRFLRLDDKQLDGYGDAASSSKLNFQFSFDNDAAPLFSDPQSPPQLYQGPIIHTEPEVHNPQQKTQDLTVADEVEESEFDKVLYLRRCIRRPIHAREAGVEFSAPGGESHHDLHDKAVRDDSLHYSSPDSDPNIQWYPQRFAHRHDPFLRWQMSTHLPDFQNMFPCDPLDFSATTSSDSASLYGESRQNCKSQSPFSGYGNRQGVFTSRQSSLDSNDPRNFPAGRRHFQDLFSSDITSSGNESDLDCSSHSSCRLLMPAFNRVGNQQSRMDLNERQKRSLDWYEPRKHCPRAQRKVHEMNLGDHRSIYITSPHNQRKYVQAPPHRASGMKPHAFYFNNEDVVGVVLEMGPGFTLTRTSSSNSSSSEHPPALHSQAPSLPVAYPQPPAPLVAPWPYPQSFPVMERLFSFYDFVRVGLPGTWGTLSALTSDRSSSALDCFSSTPGTASEVEGRSDNRRPSLGIAISAVESFAFSDNRSRLTITPAQVVRPNLSMPEHLAVVSTQPVPCAALPNIPSGHNGIRPSVYSQFQNLPIMHGSHSSEIPRESPSVNSATNFGRPGHGILNLYPTLPVPILPPPPVSELGPPPSCSWPGWQGNLPSYHFMHRFPSNNSQISNNFLGPEVLPAPIQMPFTQPHASVSVAPAENSSRPTGLQYGFAGHKCPSSSVILTHDKKWQGVSPASAQFVTETADTHESQPSTSSSFPIGPRINLLDTSRPPSGAHRWRYSPSRYSPTATATRTSNTSGRPASASANEAFAFRNPAQPSTLRARPPNLHYLGLPGTPQRTPSVPDTPSTPSGLRTETPARESGTAVAAMAASVTPGAPMPFTAAKVFVFPSFADPSICQFAQGVYWNGGPSEMTCPRPENSLTPPSPIQVEYLREHEVRVANWILAHDFEEPYLYDLQEQFDFIYPENEEFGYYTD